MIYPRIEYGAGPIVLDFMYPVGRWREGKETPGYGWSEAASGVREGYRIRRQRLLEIRLRWPEWRHQEVLAWIEAVEDDPQLVSTLYPDSTDALTFYSVHLLTPEPGEKWYPEHFPFEGVFEGLFVFRRADFGAFDLLRFPSEVPS